MVVPSVLPVDWVIGRSVDWGGPAGLRLRGIAFGRAGLARRARRRAHFSEHAIPGVERQTSGLRLRGAGSSIRIRRSGRQARQGREICSPVRKGRGWDPVLFRSSPTGTAHVGWPGHAPSPGQGLSARESHPWNPCDPWTGRCPAHAAAARPGLASNSRPALGNWRTARAAATVLDQAARAG